jgi:hypothetical protein
MGAPGLLRDLGKHDPIPGTVILSEAHFSGVEGPAVALRNLSPSKKMGAPGLLGDLGKHDPIPGTVILSEAHFSGVEGPVVALRNLSPSKKMGAPGLLRDLGKLEPEPNRAGCPTFGAFLFLRLRWETTNLHQLLLTQHKNGGLGKHDPIPGTVILSESQSDESKDLRLLLCLFCLKAGGPVIEIAVSRKDCAPFIAQFAMSGRDGAKMGPRRAA